MAVAVNGTVDDGVVAIITDGLRVVRGTREWILEYREPKKWKAFAYCATKEGLLVRIRDHLLKEHLSKLGHYNVRRVKAFDAKRGRVIEKEVVSREALAATDTARAALKRGDVGYFGVSPKAWAIIEALPGYFKTAYDENTKEKTQ